MGYKYQVSLWVLEPGKEYYFYREEYAGDWLIHAVIAAVKAKMSGVGCVKIEWR